MNKSEAFIYTTACSYIGAAAMTVAGYPLMTGIYPAVQIGIYITSTVILFASLANSYLRIPVGMIYGVLAVLSFSGLQPWINYNGSGDFLGVAMALWDLVLAVAILTVEE